MEKILVTGAFGQLGTELRLLTAGRPEFLFTDIREEGAVRRLDITDADIAGFQKTADFMYNSGMIEEAYDVSGLFF